MIAYIINGKSFGNCVDYVTRKYLEERLAQEQSKQQKADEKEYEANDGKDIMEHLSKDWKLIAATDDVRIFEGRKAMAEDIARPTKMRKSIKDPVGHISLDFHPKDTPKMTDDLMADIAQEYMSQMGMLNTPFIVVRHYDKNHPHCHIVFSRVDNEKKILTQTTNFKRNERVCKAINKKFLLIQGRSKLNTDVNKLRGKEKVRYELTRKLATLFIANGVIDWKTYVAELGRNGIDVKEKVSRSGKQNLYYCIGKHEFWSQKLDPFLSRENLEKVFARRRADMQQIPHRQPQEQPAKQKTPVQANPSTATSSSNKPKAVQDAEVNTPSQKQEPQKRIIIPPLPKGFMGARIASHEYARYEQGDVICAYICKPEEIVGKHYWIWYDFKTGQPRCETAGPSGRYIPEAFTRQLEADRASRSQSQGAAITLSRPSMGSAPVEEQGFAHGGGVSDDFKRFLEQHPGLSFDEALRRFKDEQKAKQHRKGIKLG